MSHHNEEPAKDLVDRAAEALRHARVPDGPPAELVSSTVARLESSPIPPEMLRLQERKKLMFKIFRYGSVAAALIVLATVIASIWLWDRSAPSAFADVIDNVKKAKSVSFFNRQKLGRQPEFTFMWHLQGDHIRIEFPGVMAHIADLRKKQAVQLDFIKKTAKKTELTPNLTKAFANPVSQLRNAKKKDAKRLGEEELNKRKVIVYQIKKIDFMGMKGDGDMKMCVDPKTNMPVKIRVDWVNDPTNEKAYLIFEQFEWNQEMDPKLFSLEIPEGFKLIK